MRSVILFFLSFTFCTASIAAKADVASEDAWLRNVEEVAYAEGNGFGTLEAQAIFDSHGRVERQGDILILHLTNGKTLSLKTDISCPEKRKSFVEQCLSYSLVSDLPSRHVFLIQKTYYEGSDVFLIDYKTGAETKIGALPHFNAAGDHFVTFDNNLGYGLPGYIQIWARKGADYIIEWHINDIDMPYWHMSEFVSWSGNKIKLNFWRDNQENKQVVHWPATLMKTDTGWTLQTNWPKFSD